MQPKILRAVQAVLVLAAVALLVVAMAE